VSAPGHDAQPEERVHWASVRESTFVAGMRFMVWVHRWFGRIPFLVFLYPVVCYYWATRGLARRSSMAYLRRVQAAHGSLGHAPGWVDGVRHFLSFGQTLLDQMLAMSGRCRFDRLSIHGREHVTGLIERGQGGVFVTAHLGCLEMCQAAVDSSGLFKLNVVVHNAHAEKFNRVLDKLDPERAVRLIHVSEITPATAVMLSERLARGEFIAIAGDRVPVGNGRTVRVPFLGEQARFPVGAYVLASLLECPLLFVSCLRQSDGTHAARIELLASRIELPRKRRDEALVECVRVYAGVLERLVANAPFEWFNFFPFWDPSPTGPDLHAPRHDHEPHRPH
jgi:predicted LPLAT superfamily acyltransferase